MARDFQADAVRAANAILAATRRKYSGPIPHPHTVTKDGTLIEAFSSRSTQHLLPGHGVVCVSVVVVLTGLRTVVSSVVVVEVCVGAPCFSLITFLQAESDNRAAMARHGMMNFFMV